MNGRVASAKSVEIDPKRTWTGLISRGAALCALGCAIVGWWRQRRELQRPKIQNDSDLPQRLTRRFKAS
jgi:hypothetical protein